MSLKFTITKTLKEEVTAHLAGDGNLAQWFLDRMQERAEGELAEALREQALVSVANFKAEHRPMEGLGQCEFRMAKRLHDWILKWIGVEWVYDEVFIKQLIADNADLCLRPQYAKKAAIIVAKPWEAGDIVPAPKGEPVIVARGNPGRKEAA